MGGRKEKLADFVPKKSIQISRKGTRTIEIQYIYIDQGREKQFPEHMSLNK